MRPDWVTETVATLPPLVTTEELVKLLRVGRRQVYRLLASGRMHAVKHATGGGSPNLVPRASVEKYLRSLEAG